MKFPYKYKNGNVDVTIHSDGTLIKEWPDGEEANVDYPMSVDLKITNYCDMASVCKFCHEQSNKNGLHGDLNVIKTLWLNQPAGTEIAIGGGNPLSHPYLDNFLKYMNEKEFISNLTVNSLHLVEEKFARQIAEYQKKKYIYGLGISYRGKELLSQLPKNINYDNAVFHLILGINDLDDVDAIRKWYEDNNLGNPKILILGYKQFGNGKRFYNKELQKRIDKWQEYIDFIFRNCDITISFDNLAIDQLNLKQFFTDEEWETFYLGDDGTHTMYVDAVKEKFAATSTSTKRYPLRGISGTKYMMEVIKNERR